MHRSVKISCDTNQFSESPFCVPHAKPHGVWYLSKNYHILLDTKPVYSKCSKKRIPFACV